MLIRRLSAIIGKREKVPRWERWISLLFGVIRASFLISVMVFSFSLFPFLSESLKTSLSYRIFSNIAPASYVGVVKYYRKINPQIEENKEVRTYYED